MNTPLLLTTLQRGQKARILGIEGNEALSRKLLELGVEEGQEVALLHEGPVGRDPLAIRMNDRIIALRRRDASHIHVQLLA